MDSGDLRLQPEGVEPPRQRRHHVDEREKHSDLTPERRGADCHLLVDFPGCIQARPGARHADQFLVAGRGVYRTFGEGAGEPVAIAGAALVEQEDAVIPLGLIRDAAAREVDLSVPLVVRLEGTNVEQGKAILAESGLPIVAANDLGDAARKIVAQVKQAA